jgi:hypothetical protein
MLLPRKQKTHDGERLTPHVWLWKGPQREEVDRSKTGSAQFPELSKLSAQMVELSLQEAQRDRTLPGAVPNKLAPVTWPFVGTSADAQRHAQLPLDNPGRAGTVAQSATLNGTQHLAPQTGRGAGPSRSSDFSILYSRTAFLLGPWSGRTGKILQSLMERITARGKILLHSKRLQHLRPRYAKLRMPMARASGVGAVIRKRLAKDYRCRDCGRKVGFRSHPRNLMERYVLPLLLMRPVRCAECFRRDYRLILTSVPECSPDHDETVDHIHRNAA